MNGLALRPWRAGLAVLVAAAATAPGLGAQARLPTIVFESPVDGSPVAGPTAVRVRVEPPGSPVTSVSLIADEVALCTLKRPPFECQWNAGRNVVEHTLRAVAALPDGRHIEARIRTAPYSYAETVDVDVVQLTVTVTDRDDRFKKGLRREDFRVFEDGVLQEISGFASEDVALELVVAVDFSSSMKAAMPRVKESVKRFLGALKPTDRVRVFGFNDEVYSLVGPLADLAARLKAIDRIAPWGGTALYDAIVKGIDALGRETGRRALVVFTDGEDLHSRVPLEAAERRLEASDAVLYPLGMGRAPQLAQLMNVLERLAKKTGGRAFFGDRVEKLAPAFDQILAELSNQYLLGYTPRDSTRDGRLRAIRVECVDRSLHARFRLGRRLEAR